MSYLSIDNLYKFVKDHPEAYRSVQEVIASEKIHGTSAHISFDVNGAIRFFAGGVKQEQFEALFNKEDLLSTYKCLYSQNPEHFLPVIIYGEAYGGSCQKMSHTYGPELKFVAFEFKEGENWLNVDDAYYTVRAFSLDFVPYNKGPNDINWLNEQRDLPSRQAKKNGILEDKPAEGIVIRPLVETVIPPYGKRWICKHKTEKFSEVKTPRVITEEDLKKYTEAIDISNEFVTEMRLFHVLDKLGNPDDITKTGDVVKAMIEDIKREASSEVTEWNRNIEGQIGKHTAIMYKKHIYKDVHP